MVDYYELLGVDDVASSVEIKAAYRSLAKVCHVDIVGDNKGNREMCILLNEVRGAGRGGREGGEAAWEASWSLPCMQMVQPAWKHAACLQLVTGRHQTPIRRPNPLHPTPPPLCLSLAQAYEVLMDSEQRQLYNADLDRALADEDDGYTGELLSRWMVGKKMGKNTNPAESRGVFVVSVWRGCRAGC